MNNQKVTQGGVEEVKDNLITDVVAVVKKIDPTAKILLYGSRARKDHTDNSDWDFFIATSFDKPRDLEDDLLNPLYDVMLKYDELIQVFVHSKSDWEAGASPSPIYDNIRNEGIEL